MMSSLPPQVIDDARYSTTEASKILGIHRNTLTLFRRQNLLKSLKDDISGRFLYEGRELSRFWFSRAR
jgi:DNA-binding transcriptional MerR regulator